MRLHSTLVLSVVVALGLILGPSAAWAKRPKAHAAAAAPQVMAAPALVSPVAAAPVLFTVTLKDGQTAPLTLIRYDRFFLTAANGVGTSFDIPWMEIRSIDSADSGPEIALMRGNLSPDPSPVGSVVEPRSPKMAFMKALFMPGIILHGSGFRYAGSNQTFVSLAGGELFSVVVGGFGAYLSAYPNGSDSSRQVPQALVTAGVAIFAATWLYDIAFSPSAAKAIDRSKGLSLQPRPDGMALAYRF